MVRSLPPRIMNYSVSSSSPTDELLTLSQIYSDVGNYASTVLDREHISLAHKCMTRLKKVVNELVSRECISSHESLYSLPKSSLVSTDLSALSITELHNIYRCWPIRKKEREAKGHEPFSFYYEGRIVRELRSRKAANKAEQLKIDYCVATYHNELNNMSFVFSRPLRVNGEKIFPDSRKIYNQDELTALIRLYKDYRDIIDREILVEYVDYALDLLQQDEDAILKLELLYEIAELGHRKIIRIPAWVNQKLEETVNLAIAHKTNNETVLALAILTLHIINGNSSLERKAQRIINRCYKSAFNREEDLGKRIECLHIAVTCCDYVTKFSIRKAATLWNELSLQALSSDIKLTPKQIFQLLEIAKGCKAHTDTSIDAIDALKQMLSDMAKFDCPSAKVLNIIVKLKF